MINGIYPVGNEWDIVHGKMNGNGDLLAYNGIIWNIGISQMFHGAGIFAYIWMIFGVNVDTYSIHGAYGYGKIYSKYTICKSTIVNLGVTLNHLKSSLVMLIYRSSI